MIVSVHLPKTAGSSLRKSLTDFFGDRLHNDYEDKPLNTPWSSRNKTALLDSVKLQNERFDGIDCIHGHFLPVKYLLHAQTHNVSFVTWMRHPVARLISHYNYWTSRGRENGTEQLKDRVLRENWSLEQFCLSEELQNTYAQFLFAFPLNNFEFIGITEHYESDFTQFKHHYLSPDLPIETLNVKAVSARAETLSSSLTARVEQFHAVDMELYTRALEMRQARL